MVVEREHEAAVMIARGQGPQPVLPLSVLPLLPLLLLLVSPPRSVVEVDPSVPLLASSPSVSSGGRQKPREEHVIPAQHERSSAHHWVSSMAGMHASWQVKGWTPPSKEAAQTAFCAQWLLSRQGPPTGLPSLPGLGQPVTHSPGGGGSSM